MTDRRAELAAGLAHVRARVDAAVAAAGREDPVSVIVVTKNFPVGDVDLLADLGVRDMGENREQEAREKFERVADRAALTLHFIGRLQSNKAPSVARFADVVHSVDRPKIVAALARNRPAAAGPLGVLVQVSLDGDTRRGGVAVDDVPALAAAIRAQEALRLRGVMAVAPLGADPDDAFSRLLEVSHGIRRAHPGATWISAGMSADLEAAIRHGATHLRVGTAILGSRLSLG